MADDAITDEMIREKICQMFLESTKKISILLKLKA